MRRWTRVLVATATTVGTCGVAASTVGGVAASATSKASPIVVGGAGPVADAPGIAQGFEAGIARFNKAGGLDGRKIHFAGFLDDGSDPQTDLTDVQQLVQDDHVMVVAPFWSEVSPGAAGTFLAQHRVPFLGWSSDPAYATEPTWGFGFTGSDSNPNVQRSVGMQQILAATGNTKTPGKVKLALIGNNVAAAVVANQSLSGVAKFVGMHVVYAEGAIPIAGATNYAPYAQALMGSGANVVYEVLGNSDSIGLAAALKADGYKGMIVNGVTYLPGELSSQPNEAAALNGVYVESEFLTNQNDTPAVRQEEKDLESIGAQPDLAKGTSIGYWSAIMLEQMLKATLAKEGGDPSKVTGATLRRTVNAGFTYQDPIAGGIGTVAFPVNESIPSGCGTLVKTVGTSFKLVEPYVCTNDVDVSTHKAVDEVTGKPLKG